MSLKYVDSALLQAPEMKILRLNQIYLTPKVDVKKIQGVTVNFF